MKKLNGLQIVFLVSTIVLILMYGIIEGLYIAYSGNLACIAAIVAYSSVMIALCWFAIARVFKKEEVTIINKKAKIFPLCLLALYTGLFLFESFTHIYFWSLRAAYHIDFLWLGIFVSQFSIFVFACLYLFTYSKTRQLRLSTLFLNIAAGAVLIVKFFQNLNNVKLIAGEVSPPQDIFIYAFEFSYTIILLVLFVANFIYLLTKHHFKKSA